MPEENKAVEEEVSEEEEKKLPFANAQIVRVMRQNMASDKMIKADVKKGMNQFLADVCADVSQRMDGYPYAMIDYRIFKEATESYRTMHKVKDEKVRIKAHLEAIKLDCDKLIRDIEETFVTSE